MTRTAPLQARPTVSTSRTLPPGPADSPAVSVSIVVAIVCSLTAVWIAAGSSGLLGHSLRHALTWIFAGGAVVAAWPRDGSIAGRIVALGAAALVAVALTPAILPAVNIAGVLVVIAVLAWLAPLTCWRPLRVACGAVAIFTVYRLALQAIPSVWLVSDRVGGLLGNCAGLITGQKLAVGLTFGGVDFLVLSGAFYGLWLANTPAPRARRATYGAIAILVAHFAYLALLSFTPAFLNNVPAATREDPSPIWTVSIPGFLNGTLKLDAVAVRQFVPNNLPLFAILFHSLAIAAMVRWGAWKQDVPRRRAYGAAAVSLATAAAAIAALALPLVTTYCKPANSLEGKKIVISDRLFGNFLRPQHGDYGHLSIGMYGNFQPFVESLGGRGVVSSNLTDEDLAGADALILIYPNKTFTDEPIDRVLRMADRYLGFSVSRYAQQLQIERIWKYVENGGTLLVMGEHTVADENVPPPLRSHVNEVLAPSAIRVNFDSAMFEIGGWLQSYQALAHPITAGVEDSRNQFGVVIGASLDVKFPARPVLVGRWGWADPGDEGSSASMMGNHRYDPGERLGDMVLIAEQSYGKGRLVAFGDPSNVTNGITIGAHPFNARLYSYLTHNPAKDGSGDTPQAAWRQVIGVLLAGLLIALLARNPHPLSGAGVVLAMVLSLWFWNGRIAAAAEILPDGRKLKSAEIHLDRGKLQPNYTQLAYIDNAHLGYYSEESWRTEGTMGLAMNLMRSGYLTLMAPDLKKERLDGAGLLVIPAPTRSLTDAERDHLKEWVSQGGTLILTVGWDRYQPNRDLLADFSFYLEQIPLEALPAQVVASVDRAKPGYEILAAGVNNQGVYVFDVRKGEQALELTVHPNGDVLSEKPHTSASLHHALLLHGYLPPEPLGYFKVPYLPSTYVRFHAAWPIRCSDPASVVAAIGRDELPVIIWRNHGKGKVVLIGDSEFATNQNLEHEGGEAFEGMRENADFWRWLISYYIRGEKDWWRPPPPAASPTQDKKPGDGFELEGK